jgi:hypothetical protein
MSSGIYNKEISDYVTGLTEKKEKIKLDNAVNFNSFELKDQHTILWLYQTKVTQQELKSSIEDKIACIEETANLYRAQKCAFQDVLTKEGFEIASEVPKTYGGRIAILTDHGTFIILGKSKRRGRLITMKRIHTPGFNYDKKRGHLHKDLKLDNCPYLSIINDDGYRGSPARALAVNPHGADDDELEEVNANDTVMMMGMRTAMFLMEPRKHEEVVLPKELEEVK